MIRSLLIIILVAIHSTSYSQISKGTIQLGGNIGYSKSNLNDRPPLVSDYENRLLSILPKAGIFVTPNTAIGLGLVYTNGLEKIQISSSPLSFPVVSYEQTKLKQSLFLANPYLRLHKFLSENLALFAEINAGYGGGNGMVEYDRVRYTYSGGIGSSPQSEERAHSEIDTKHTAWGVSLNPGLIFFPSAKWGIDLSIGVLGYTELKTKIDKTKTDSDLNLFTNLSNVSVGVRYYLIR